jgi:hypothetical protein
MFSRHIFTNYVCTGVAQPHVAEPDTVHHEEVPPAKGCAAIAAGGKGCGGGGEQRALKAGSKRINPNSPTGRKRNNMDENSAGGLEGALLQFVKIRFCQILNKMLGKSTKYLNLFILGLGSQLNSD